MGGRTIRPAAIEADRDRARRARSIAAKNHNPSVATSPWPSRPPSPRATSAPARCPRTQDLFDWLALLLAADAANLPHTDKA
jgi:hypothetical protein